MDDQLCSALKKMYAECVEEVYGEKCLQVEVSVMKNNLVFIEKRLSTQQPGATSDFIRGHNINQFNREWCQRRFREQLDHRITAAIGSHIISVQSDIVIDSDERMGIVHFDHDLE